MSEINRLEDEAVKELTEDDYSKIELIKSKLNVEKLHQEFSANKLTRLEYIGILKADGYTLWDINRFLRAISNEKEIANLKTQAKDTAITPLYKPLKACTTETNELFNSPNLLHKICVILGKRIAREYINRTLLFVLGLSHRTNHKVMLYIKGESSSGKNYLVDNVIKIYMPTRERGRMSKTAHEYGELNEYEILYIKQQQVGEQADSLKLTSDSDHGYWLEIASYDRATKERSTDKIWIPSITLISTTTHIKLDHEDETRSWNIAIDESKEQSRAVLEKTDELGLAKIIGEKSGDHKQTVSDGINSLPIFNSPRRPKLVPTDSDAGNYILDDIIVPFTLNDIFPVSNIRVRRDYPKFLYLIQYITYLHAHQRNTFTTLNGEQTLVATVADVWYALRLGGLSLTGAVSGIDERTEEILKAIKSKEMEDTKFLKAKQTPSLNSIFNDVPEPAFVLPQEYGWTTNDLITYIHDYKMSSKGTSSIYAAVKQLCDTGAVVKIDKKTKSGATQLRLNAEEATIIEQPDYKKLHAVGLKLVPKLRCPEVFDPVTGERVDILG